VGAMTPSCCPPCLLPASTLGNEHLICDLSVISVTATGLPVDVSAMYVSSTRRRLYLLTMKGGEPRSRWVPPGYLLVCHRNTVGSGGVSNLSATLSVTLVGDS
jgi:hypothetical protein